MEHVARVCRGAGGLSFQLGAARVNVLLRLHPRLALRHRRIRLAAGASGQQPLRARGTDGRNAELTSRQLLRDVRISQGVNFVLVLLRNQVFAGEGTLAI